MAPRPLASLRTVVFAGEVYPCHNFARSARVAPEAALWNLYGPTETNVCTYYKVEQLPQDDQTIPIGRACSNTDVFAVAANGEQQRSARRVELYVRGATVMKGYWGQPAKSAEVLVPDPLSDLPDLVYRTGDLVMRHPTVPMASLVGVITRSRAVDIGSSWETSSRPSPSTHPDLDESAVVSVPHDAWGSAIVAWVTPRDGVEVTEVDVRRYVAGRLPSYMVPTSIRIVEQLPRTSTGKVDRPLLTERAEELRLSGS